MMSNVKFQSPEAMLRNQHNHCQGNRRSVTLKVREQLFCAMSSECERKWRIALQKYVRGTLLVSEFLTVYSVGHK